MNLYFLPHARSQEQIDEMTALEVAGICIFCPSSYSYDSDEDVLLEYDSGKSYKKRVKGESTHWVLLHNEYPYLGTRHHLLLVPKRHVTELSELSGVEQVDLLTMLGDLAGRFGHCAIGLRSGDMAYNGGTIAHLHVHLVVAEEEPEVKVRFRMSGNPPTAFGRFEQVQASEDSKTP
jgi:diadenosine tetraphosphate (Ap4A) HIT family hydrolase